MYKVKTCFWLLHFLTLLHILKPVTDPFVFSLILLWKDKATQQEDIRESTVAPPSCHFAHFGLKCSCLYTCIAHRVAPRFIFVLIRQQYFLYPAVKTGKWFHRLLAELQPSSETGEVKGNERKGGRSKQRERKSEGGSDCVITSRFSQPSASV